MLDISMCEGKDCPVRNNCYRFRAVPSGRQSYAQYWAQATTRGCDNFIRVEAGDRVSPPAPMVINGSDAQHG